MAAAERKKRVTVSINWRPGRSRDSRGVDSSGLGGLLELSNSRCGAVARESSRQGGLMDDLDWRGEAQQLARRRIVKIAVELFRQSRSRSAGLATRQKWTWYIRRDLGEEGEEAESIIDCSN